MTTWDSYLENQRDVDGIQFTWNVIPHSRVDAQQLVVPVASFFTPLKVRSYIDISIYFNLILLLHSYLFQERPEGQPAQPPLEYDPVLCQKSTCKSVLNPFRYEHLNFTPICIIPF